MMLRVATSRWVWVVVLAAAIVPYLNSLDGGFHYDDEHALLRNSHLRHLSSIPDFFLDSATFSAEPNMAMYRPLLQTSFALNYAASAYEAVSWHVVNVLLHALAAMGAFALFRRLVAPAPALVAGLLFALHPAHSQAVNYLSSRSETMCMALVLWALVLLQSRRGVWSAVVYGAALLTKSAAVALLPLALLLSWLRPKGDHAWRPLVPHGVVTAGYLLLISVEGFLPRSLAQDVRPQSEQIWTQLKAILYYLQLVIIPRGLSIEHDFTIATSLRQAPVLLAAMVLLSLLWLILGVLGSGAGLQKSGRAGGLVLGGMWFVAALGLPFLVPLNVLINEHRLYLPLAGFSLVLAVPLVESRAMVAWKSMPPPLPWVLPLLLCLFFGATTWTQNRLWHSELDLWTSATLRAPNSFRAWSNLALAHHAEGHTELARNAYDKALRLNPGHARAWNNLGLLLEESGSFAEARAAYRQAALLAPGFSGPLANLGRLSLATGDTTAAASQLAEALSRNPDDVEALLHQGRLQQLRGQIESAQTHFERVLELDPVSAAAANNLGMLLAQSGDDAATHRWLQQALVWEPGQPQAAANLMLLELEMHGVSRREAYRQVLDHFPDRGELALALGDLHARAGAWQEALEVYEDLLHRGVAPPGLQGAVAAAYQQLGQSPQALAAFQLAVLQMPADRATRDEWLRMMPELVMLCNEAAARAAQRLPAPSPSKAADVDSSKHHKPIDLEYLADRLDTDGAPRPHLQGTHRRVTAACRALPLAPSTRHPPLPCSHASSVWCRSYDGLCSPIGCRRVDSGLHHADRVHDVAALFHLGFPRARGRRARRR